MEWAYNYYLIKDSKKGRPVHIYHMALKNEATLNFFKPYSEDGLIEFESI
jgi:hypothetical protein